ncbi:MAG TPA: thiamine pyrophosphate-dependent enzyme [Candidatus Acidoferrales bacterium]|nr:thiamine pyrophosphate-dependent enzyme [Candidatus Acidoferrales bacterium]
MTAVISEYRSDYTSSWCPGCGDYGVLKSVEVAFHELSLKNEEIVLVSGIGCNGRFPHNFRTYGFHTLHGRVLPIAQGISISRPDLCVVGVAGDGDAFAIGGGHMPHAARRNPDITLIVLDNGIYGQTKGQPSPTTPFGYKTRVTPKGNQEDPIDISRLALAYGISFLGRGFPGKPNHLGHLIAEGIKHKGFALIHVLNPCPTFHDTWKEYAAKVKEVDSSYDPKNYDAACELVKQTDQIPIGIIFQQYRPTLNERITLGARTKLEMKELLTSFR